jgi:parvulin-like peptidyl-prolyl isomerase
MFMRVTLISLLLLSVVDAPASEVLDGIVATVNNRVILTSDWNGELRFECFMSRRQLADVTPQEKKAALDRLIDRELLHQQMAQTNLKPATADEVQNQINGLKKEQSLQRSGESWDAELSRYQLSETMVADYVGSELTELRLVDARFRASIQIPESEIAKYYREQLVPKLPAPNSLSLAAATPKIREILIQEKINQLLNSWLETLRSQAHIRILSSNLAADPNAMRAQAP